MTQNHSSLADAMMRHISDLIDERHSHEQRIEEIDEALAKAARQLGVPVSDISEPGPSLPRLRKEARPQDMSMGQGMLAILLAADHGYSRSEMRNELVKTPKFAEQIGHNVNMFYNTVARYLKKDKIVDIDGLLYHPQRAPLPEGEEDPSGQHLPANVSSLFGPHDRRAGNGDE